MNAYRVVVLDDAGALTNEAAVTAGSPEEAAHMFVEYPIFRAGHGQMGRLICKVYFQTPNGLTMVRFYAQPVAGPHAVKG